MPKGWELTLCHRGEGFEIKSWNKIEAEDIVKLLAQFQVVLAMELKKENEQIINELRLKDDDIPF